VQDLQHSAESQSPKLRSAFTYSSPSSGAKVDDQVNIIAPNYVDDETFVQSPLLLVNGRLRAEDDDNMHSVQLTIVG
jgi:hypothetical protein